MYYIHWLNRIYGNWRSMPADEYREMSLELAFMSSPEAYIDQQQKRDEPD